MWQGQQPPGGEQNPQDPNQNPYQQPGYQQPNPYQQPGFQQQNPYPPGQPGWTVPGAPQPPQPPQGGGGNGNRTKLVAIVAATAVVVAAGVTGFLVLGGDKDDQAGDDKDKVQQSPSSSAPEDPSASASAGGGNPRGTDDEKPTIAGWKVVINPKWGTAFDVPADWAVQSSDTIVGFEDTKDAGAKPLITMSAPAYLKEKWCTSDEDKDGTVEDTALAAVGTKGANGAKNVDEVAVNQVPWWVFGGYTQPDRKSITLDEKATAFTTESGIEGSYAWARSKGSPQKGKSKCASDGKAITFGFKNSKGDFVAWSLYGATGVSEELSDKTIMKILGTVRLHGTPAES
ncbi:proline-rich domain-containing protein [Streptomyces sp. NPDC050704]|uniref:proline-rich domain-containing protein n=1 Tax=Streptomyces sp. NPDC050704 TaxID=3157219 RepID=UPI0034391609